MTRAARMTHEFDLRFPKADVYRCYVCRHCGKATRYPNAVRLSCDEVTARKRNRPRQDATTPRGSG